jgi:hypothetical protein
LCIHGQSAPAGLASARSSVSQRPTLDIVSMVAGGQDWFVVRLTRQQAPFLV